MDRNHSCAISTYWAALRKRYDGCGMGADCAADACAASIWDAPEKWICARSFTRSSSFCRAAASGGHCRRNFRRTRRFRAIFMLGAIPEGGKRSLEFWSGKPAESSGASPNQRPRSSTARARRRRRPAVREATMPANAFTDVNGISSPTPMAFCSASMFTPPMFRTAMAPFRYSNGCAAGSPSYGTSSPIAFTAVTSLKTPSLIAGHGRLRSSSGRTASKASSFCRGAGSSNVLLPGAAGAVALPKTSRDPRQPKSHGSLSLTSGS